MSEIILRGTKGSPLTHQEVDDNFTNLNNDKAGYVTGEGGTITQNTDKGTDVELNTKCGTITLSNAPLGADDIVSFDLTNSKIAATDVIVLNHASGGTAGKYALNAQAAAGSASINVTNISGGSLSEAIVIRFAVIKAVTA
tara:strand:- start:89 stop:511 length:423 start_codon:yes stop_codon:yes gene_type:complete